MSTLAFAAMCALVLATPFETRHAVLVLPWQQFTFTELVWMAVAGTFVTAQAARRQMPVLRTPVTTPWLAWMAVMILAAVSADADRANAIKTTGRLIVFGLTGLMVATSVTNARRMAVVLATAAAAGIVVALFAILEVWRVSSVLAGLNAFRSGVSTVGGQVRASSTLQYPTITAMYLELVLCGALGVLLWVGERRGWRIASVAFASLLVMIAGLSLTLTRAAMLAGMSGVLLTAWWRYRHRGADRGFVLVAACALWLCVAPILFGSAELAAARWSTDNRQGWYRASFEAPREVTGQPGALITVPIAVTNQGKITWSLNADPPFHVSYHWVDEKTTRVVAFDGVRTPLPADIAPGTRVAISARVRFPEIAGSYRIAWDVVQEGRLWFVGEPGATTTFTAASVSGALLPTPAQALRPGRRSPAVLPTPSAIPGRLALWSAAMRMAADHPWLGVGPDNFRLRYGRYLGLDDADTRVHSNNLYLEVLTGGGVFAAAAFLWFLWRVIGVVRTQRKRLVGAAAAVYTGVAAAGLAYLAHGLLDSFLTFTPTAFASAVILGLAIAPALWAESGADEAAPAQWTAGTSGPS
ncbi:MAG TPA: O-antigen ligase family protein [Vicinamibacterales bacterium]|nr:O-antigen ligase family protein [Vicinamibacterales bacterium]